MQGIEPKNEEEHSHQYDELSKKEELDTYSFVKPKPIHYGARLKEGAKSSVMKLKSTDSKQQKYTHLKAEEETINNLYYQDLLSFYDDRRRIS